MTEPVVCITGPQWIGPNYFNHFYRPLIEKALTDDPLTRFVLGDAAGTERHAQQLLAALGVPGERVTVFVRAGDAPSPSAQKFTVATVRGDNRARDNELAARATTVLVVLPQFGAGQSTALLAALSDHRGGNMEPVLELVRCNSEPHDARFTVLQGLLHEAWYAPDKHTMAAARDAFLAAIAQRDPDAFVESWSLEPARQ